MANLEILSNVVHQGIVLKKGMVVSDGAEHPVDAAQNLTGVVTNLIDRGLAKEVGTAPTHTKSLVNGAQEPLLVNAAAADGGAPNAESDAAIKAQAKARQQAADPTTANAVIDQASAESQPVVTAAPPTAEQKRGPTNEEIAAAAAAVG